MMATARWMIEDYHQSVATGILAERPVELLGGEIIEMAPEGEDRAYFSDEAGEC